MKSRGISWQKEWDFFINPKTGKLQFNEVCKTCRHDCRQSYKACLVSCPSYQKVEGKGK
jgi:hypothetical protein